MKKCFKCNTIKEDIDFHNNKHKKDGLASQCKNCKKITDKNYIENNKQKRRDYRLYKRQTDALFKIKHNLRNRLYKSLKRIKENKNTSTTNFLGANYKEVKTHIEKQFKEDMTWDNYGQWHIDHIIPLSSANTKEELIKLFNYKNTQPLWASENMKKGSKIL